MDINEKLREIYFSGGSRGEAMEVCGLNTNQIAGKSHRLELYWKWPLENRISGIKPPKAKPGPRKKKKTPPKDLVEQKPPSAPAAPVTEPQAAAPALPKAALAPSERTGIKQDASPLEDKPRARSRFISARERRERGLAHDEPPQGTTSEEKFLHELYRKQYE